MASDPTRRALTAAGAWVGTPGYMAPEQLRGAAADARSDLFALGAVLYEMVTGRRAVDDGAAPVAPADVQRIIRKLLESDPGLRYQTARELIVDLRRLQRDSTPSPAPAPVRPRAMSWTARVGVAAILLLAAGTAAWWIMSRRTAPAATSTTASSGDAARLVVLPFENLTRQSDDDWLSGALADSIGAGLQSVDTLTLVPRERVVELYAAESRRDSDTLSSQLAGQLSKRLRVRFYVHGSYQKVGESLRLAARLVDLEADAVKAQETIDGSFANVLQLEDQLATRFAAKLNPRTSKVTRTEITADIQAYRLVSDARTQYALGRFAEALPLLQQAVERDPKYALAWAMLSKTLSRMAAPATVTGRPKPEVLKAALEAATSAVELAPGAVESQVALALAYRGLRDFDRMVDAARTAVAFDSHNGEARTLLATALSSSPGFGCPTSARPDEAEAAFREALRADPLQGSSYLNLTVHLWWMNRQVEALTSVDDGLAAQPGNAMLTRSRPFNLVFANRVDEAEAILNQRVSLPVAESPNDTLTRAFIALRRKKYAEAEAVMRRPAAQDALASLAWTMISAVAYFQADRPKEGAALLERGMRAEPSCIAWASTPPPALSPYRHTSEYVDALARVRR
jgi:TolB-like protein